MARINLIKPFEGETDEQGYPLIPYGMAADETMLRIATWNLEWWPYGEPNWSLWNEFESELAREAVIGFKDEKIEKTKEYIKAANPQILCLQEIVDVDKMVELLTELKYPTIITAATSVQKPGSYGLNGIKVELNTTAEQVYTTKQNEDGSYEQIKVYEKDGTSKKEPVYERTISRYLVFASKFEVERYWLLDFAGNLVYLPDNAVPSRGVIGVLLKGIPKIGNMIVYNVHLKSNIGSTDSGEEKHYRAYKNAVKREDAISYILSDLKQNAGPTEAIGTDVGLDYYAVIAGDFNSSYKNQDEYPFTYNYEGIKDVKERTFEYLSTLPKREDGKTPSPFLSSAQQKSSYTTVPDSSIDYDHVMIHYPEGGELDATKLNVSVKESERLSSVHAKNLSRKYTIDFNGSQWWWLVPYDTADGTKRISDHNLVSANLGNIVS